MQEFRDPNTFTEGKVLFIDKEINWTSFDVVNKIRKDLRSYLGIKKIKVGHTGTLDPLATGLVIICTGKATKQIIQYQDLEKSYVATIRFGATTPSYDLETDTDQLFPWEHISRNDLELALKDFTGDIEQVPPLFSAKSIGGKRAYEIARKGKVVELPPNRVHITKIEILKFEMPEAELLVECGKGTYIRSLAHDVGKHLKSGAHLTALRRIQIGDYHVNNAITVKNFENNLKQL